MSSFATMILIFKGAAFYFALFNSIAVSVRVWFVMAHKATKFNETQSVRLVAALWALFFVLSQIKTP